MWSEDVEHDGRIAKLTLSEDGVLCWTNSAFSDSVILREDVLGLSRDRFTLTLFTFKLGKVGCFGSSSSRVRKDVVLHFRDSNTLDSWYQRMQAFLDNQGRPKRLYILINPFGGKKLAKRIFQQKVKPFLSAAGVSFTLQETEYRNHAKELAKSMEISQYDGIVCVSGDGLLLEVLNGLLARSDWKMAMKMRLGVIPAGTGNGMAKSVLHYGNESYNVENATFAIIRGNTHSLDVATVVQGQNVHHSVLSLAWGIVADVDIESERFRGLGELRNDIYSLIRITRLRKYRGTLAYVPAPGYEGSLDHISREDSDLLSSSIPDMNIEKGQQWGGYSGSMSVPEKSEWRIMNGNFILVWLMNVPWATQTVLAAPKAELSDGFLDLLIIKECSRRELLKSFLKLSDGTHVKSKIMDYLKVRAVCLAPGGQVNGGVEGGYISLDGEVLARGAGAYGDGSKDPMCYGSSIYITVEKGLATVFCA
ncbi:hypothetical protein KP509_24G035100 [Ceratopteris richardii]|uniref:sphingosine kinase n=4 Tax=Ceratopteris richardii TaxID=49495 RepID=A0A8T2RVH3_CERRI|nr:hypothetical protein KP509_24G035100 [Ceratopteris richardii]KAH7299891.1 hypothetical protein KP509_24G035100 [Ceratopteris richardii]KAH7299892.1 hypothetical protein KP509_24G035100 [Ceratopteris richardii]KAH7299893.1 hypothetical protein KP509_24G035100 [Ceratopteris richardii]